MKLRIFTLIIMALACSVVANKPLPHHHFHGRARSGEIAYWHMIYQSR